MQSYILENSSINEIIGLIDKLLHTRITFFDINNSESDQLEIPAANPYCRARRMDTFFDQACRNCDIRNLEIAQQQKCNHIYRCHAGLIEAIIPLYGKRGEYLGALLFGQMRDEATGKKYRGPQEYEQEFFRTPAVSRERAGEISRLLQLVSESIISRELIKFRQERWADILRETIDARLSDPPSLTEMAGIVHHSKSFISHRFPVIFGTTPGRYILERRMQKARQLLSEGNLVYETAEWLGYCDEFHFSNTFRAYWGSPPSQFIRKGRG